MADQNERGLGDADTSHKASKVGAPKSVPHSGGVCTTPRVLQLHFAFMRGNARVLLARGDKSELNGQPMVAIKARPEECREFDDPVKAEAFIREAMASGDIVGIGFSPDEQHEYGAIAKELDRLGYRSRKGGRWSRSSVRDILARS